MEVVMVDKTFPPTTSHSFKAIYDRDIPWEDGADNNILTLPKGERRFSWPY